MNDNRTKEQNTTPEPTKLEKYVLEKVFKPPIIFYTYEGGKVVTVKQLKAYDIVTAEGEEIQKTDIMFALPASNFEDAKAGIRIDANIKAQNLRTAIKARERPVIVNTKQLRKGNDRNVRIVLRSGHILQGKQLTVAQYNLVMRVRGKVVLVYRHGILEYTIASGTKKS